MADSVAGGEKMSYVSIGALAIDLKTSNQKIGQIINSLEIERKTVRDGKWYNKCIAVADVDRIKAAIKDFRVDQTGRKGKPSPEKVDHYIGDNSDKLVVNPIVGLYWGAGEEVRIGQGIWAYWDRESYEIIREG